MKSLLRLREFIQPYIGRVFLALVFLLIGTGGRLVIPGIIQQVIDVGLIQGESRYLLRSGGIILGIGILVAILTFAQRYMSEWISHRVTFDLRNKLYDHIQHLSFSFHDHAQTGQLISRTIEDVRSIQRFTGFGIVEMLRISLLLIGVVILLFLENPRLAVIALLPMIPLLLTTTRFGQRIGWLFLAVDNALGDLSARLQENVSGVQVVRAFAREPYEINRFDHLNRELYDARVTIISAWSRIMPTSHMLVALSTILIMWFGGNMVLRGEMSLGEVVAFNSYLLLMAEPARQLVWLVNLGGEAVAGSRRIFDVLDREPEIRSPENAIELPHLQGRVDFDHVCISYDENQNYALQDINLAVEPNQIIALIGATGSGKTTLVNLIPRFYDVTSGRVKVDGIDVREAGLISLRSQIGIVLQTSLLFSDSIRENIAYGRPGASLEAVIEAAKAAQAHEFIMSMQQGYETIVGERGITLSGGQRQRVAIARALLMDPSILILDDSTSSVDTQTERLIQKALDKLMEGRTTFVIAQRLSTVRRADVILVLEQGRIVERGTHVELISKDGLYREIYNLQLSRQEEDDASEYKDHA